MADLIPFTHADLCAIASKWLRLNEGRGGHGCQVAFTEIRSHGNKGEKPDAIGLRACPWRGGAVVVECKTSRADFLADAKKPHRQQPETGMGRWRYFMCPEGLLQPEEMPAGWGLLWVNKRGTVRCQRGFAMRFWGNRKNEAGAFMSEETDGSDFIFEQRNHAAEFFALTELISRVGDAEKMNLRLREADARGARLFKLYEELREWQRNAQADMSRQRWRIRQLEEQLESLGIEPTDAGAFGENTAKIRRKLKRACDDESQALDSSTEIGRRDWTRTSDPHHVK